MRDALKAALDEIKVVGAERQKIREEANERISVLTAEVKSLKGRLCKAEGANERMRFLGFRQFPLSEIGRFLENRFRTLLIERFLKSGAFLAVSLDICKEYLTNCAALITEDLRLKGVHHPIDVNNHIDRVPDDLPPSIFGGDQNEDPNLAWWVGLWEEAVDAALPQNQTTRALRPEATVGLEADEDNLVADAAALAFEEDVADPPPQ